MYFIKIFESLTPEIQNGSDKMRNVKATTMFYQDSIESRDIGSDTESCGQNFKKAVKGSETVTLMASLFLSSMLLQE